MYLSIEYLSLLYFTISKPAPVLKGKMSGACSSNGEKRNACRILVGEPEEKRPLGRPRRRWVDNIKMELRETG
jgi:hypothetical protein